MLSSEELKRMRARAGKTQAFCAENIGVSVHAWRNWEAPPSASRHRAIPGWATGSILRVLDQIYYNNGSALFILGHVDDLSWIPFQSIIKSIRKGLGLSLSKASSLVHHSPVTWTAWELPRDSERYRLIPLHVAELFAIKNGIPYQIKGETILVPTEAATLILSSNLTQSSRSAS